jgi:hypothetical protein
MIEIKTQMTRDFFVKEYVKLFNRTQVISVLEMSRKLIHTSSNIFYENIA